MFTPRKYNITILVIFTFILLVIAGKSIAFYSGSPSKQIASNQQFSHGGQAVALRGEQTGSQVEKKNRVESRDLDSSFIKIQEVEAEIIKVLCEDEAARARLVKTTESAEKVSYIFKISRNPNIEKLISNLCRQSAEKARVNPMALQSYLGNHTAEFLIPENRFQKVLITIPRDTDSMPSYMMVTCPDWANEDETISGAGIGTIGQVTSQDSWRYKRLVEIGQP